MKNTKEKEFVVVRGPPGVFAGYLAKENGKEVEMTDCFCLWKYSGAASLNQLALEGVKNVSDCKFSVSVSRMRLKDIFQVITCTPEAKKNLLGVPRWKV